MLRLALNILQNGKAYRKEVIRLLRPTQREEEKKLVVESLDIGCNQSTETTR
jgi:hypothetical protein